MHIPDGYLSPQTFIPLYAVMIPVWKKAIDKIKKEVDLKHIPYIAISSAFSFLVMMFNVPIPHGTTGHAVGSAVIAIILGPWTAVISVSIALMIQAVVFGDGGITTLGANCFNMAFVMPFVAYYVFRVLSKKGNLKRTYIASFISGYLSLNVAALLAAFEFGIQPLIASEGGKALYAPYPLKMAIAAMGFEHMIVFGFVEGFVTAGIVYYLIKQRDESFAGLKMEEL